MYHRPHNRIFKTIRRLSYERRWLELKQYIDSLDLTYNEIGLMIGYPAGSIKRLVDNANFYLNKPPKPERSVWDTKEWLYEHFVNQKLSIQKISIIVGVGYKEVSDKLVEYGLRQPTVPVTRCQETPAIDDEFIMYYYATKEEYLRWTKINCCEPDVRGGWEMTQIGCAKLLGISAAAFGLALRRSIANGLLVNIRDAHEIRVRRARTSHKSSPPQPFIANHEFFINRTEKIAREIAENRQGREDTDKEKRIID